MSAGWLGDGRDPGLVLGNGSQFVAGAGVTRALGQWRRGRDLTTVLATSFLAGVAGFGVCAQFLYVLGFSMGIVQLPSWCAALAATGLARLRSSRPLTPLLR